jgi:ribosome biogenesis GTPase
MNLNTIGWHPFFEAQFNELNNADLRPARVVEEHRERYLVWSDQGELTAQVSGKLRHAAVLRSDFPAAGDWVAIEPTDNDQAIIQAVLPRRTAFIRKGISANDKADNQVLAANVDTVFLVSGLDRDFNVRRIERYLTIAWDSGVSPVIILNKADLCDQLEECIAETEAAAIGVPVHTMNALEEHGSDGVLSYLAPGKTIAFLGSSGVGKSTIINRLLGEERQQTGEISEAVGKGRHTTTTRELILHRSGAILIDTPGMRQLGMWTDESGLSRTFDDLESVAANCRFADCTHNEEPGCAVRAAIESGELDVKRLENYRRLQREIAFQSRRNDKAAQNKASREWARKIRMHQNAMKELRKKGLR